MSVYITDIVINTQWGQCEVSAILSEGWHSVLPIALFSYYSDELSFTKEELVGLTVDEARQLRHKRDVEYLRS